MNNNIGVISSIYNYKKIISDNVITMLDVGNNLFIGQQVSFGVNNLSIGCRIEITNLFCKIVLVRRNQSYLSIVYSGIDTKSPNAIDLIKAQKPLSIGICRKHKQISLFKQQKRYYNSPIRKACKYYCNNLLNKYTQIIYKLKYYLGYTESVAIYEFSIDSNDYVDRTIGIYNELSTFEQVSFNNDLIENNISSSIFDHFYIKDENLSDLYLIYNTSGALENINYIIDVVHFEIIYMNERLPVHGIYYIDIERLELENQPNMKGVYNTGLCCDLCFHKDINGIEILNVVKEQHKISFDSKRKLLVKLKKIVNKYKTADSFMKKHYYVNKNTPQKRYYMTQFSHILKYDKHIYEIPSRYNKNLLKSMTFESSNTKSDIFSILHHKGVMCVSDKETYFLPCTSNTKLWKLSKSDNDCVQLLKDSETSLMKTYSDIPQHILFGTYWSISFLLSLGVQINLCPTIKVNEIGLSEQFFKVKHLFNPKGTTEVFPFDKVSSLQLLDKESDLQLLDKENIKEFQKLD